MCVSVQRSMYKDLVLLLQKDTFLTSSQLKSKVKWAIDDASSTYCPPVGIKARGGHFIVESFFLFSLKPASNKSIGVLTNSKYNYAAVSGLY